MNIKTYEKLFKPPDKVFYSFPSFDDVLILSPHPDDETLGCGGFIRKILNKGKKVSIALLTDGCKGGREIELVEVRRKEFNLAIAQLGNPQVYLLNYPDDELEKYFSECSWKISKIIETVKPKIIFIPYIFDYASDHLITKDILLNSLGSLSSVREIEMVSMYEIWTPILYPTHYINISDEMEIKCAAIDHYKSQQKAFGIKEKIITLNKLRAEFSFLKKVQYMECYKTFFIDEFLKDISLFCRGISIRKSQPSNE